jgi:ribosome-associated protein
MTRRWQVAPGVWVAEDDVAFRFTRSGGPGGQHVNKVSTRVEVTFDLAAATAFTTQQKDRLRSALGRRLSATGVLRVASDESRSQSKNRDLALRRLIDILRRALKPEVPRVPTRPTRASTERRLRAKKQRSKTKGIRRAERADE